MFQIRRRILSSVVRTFFDWSRALLMVGNSFRSDIEPVLKLGGWAAHIPFHTTWQHEVIEEYEHPHLLKLEFFTQLKDVLL